MDTKGWFGSVLAGAGLMYLLDPERGGRRRAIVRDKFSGALDTVGEAAGKTGRDLRNRARGVVAEVRSLGKAQPVPDEVLAARVRSRIGRVVSHPSSIEVIASAGVVTLGGPVLAREVDELISCVSRIRGVEDVENRLEIHERPDGVAGLQGPGRPAAPRFEFAQENWSPTARLCAGAAGGGLAALGVKKRGIIGAAIGVVGAGLVARAVTNLALGRLLGFGPGRRGMDVRKTIHVDAPPDRVFDYWAEISNFPLFLSHVRDVRDSGRGISHWKIEGPAGVPVEFDAVTTAIVPNQMIAWKTVPGEAVKHSGIVRFDEDERGGTRVDLRMTYKPPAGAFGHAVAALFGTDPKKALDDDLVRFKSLIETGKTTAHGEEVVAVEVAEDSAAAPAEEASGAERPQQPETTTKRRTRRGAAADRPSPPRAES